MLLSHVGSDVSKFVLSEMRKQRKMGHITIVGPSKTTVKSRLDKLLQREASDPKKGTAFAVNK